MTLKIPEAKESINKGNEIKEAQTKETAELNTELLQSIDRKLDLLLAAQETEG
jgi:hypothetical protein